MHTSPCKWIPLPSQQLIPSYIQKDLGFSYIESLWRTNDMQGKKVTIAGIEHMTNSSMLKMKPLIAVAEGPYGEN